MLKQLISLKWGDEMKKILLLLVLGMIVASNSQLFAFGIGGYVAIGGNDSYLYKPTPKINYNNFVFGFGLAIDLNLVKDGFLNYRANLGYDGLINNDLKIDYFNRISLTNSFGFRIMQNEKYRFYAGPQFALRYQFCKTDFVIGHKLFWKQNYVINSFGLGLGAIIGVDLQLTRRVTISPEIGLRYEFYTGRIKNDVAYIFMPYRYMMYQNTAAHGFEGSLNITVLHRID